LLGLGSRQTNGRRIGDYYRILASIDADEKAIKSAYRKSLASTTPTSQGPGAADKFKEINEAYGLVRPREASPLRQPDRPGELAPQGRVSPVRFRGRLRVEYGNADDQAASDFFRRSSRWARRTVGPAQGPRT
jgi:DnaJ-class molecular chaperone